MKHPHQADSTADEPGIYGKFLEGLRRSFEKQVVEEFLIGMGEISEFIG
jgi:hypothetical protein